MSAPPFPPTVVTVWRLGQVAKQIAPPFEKSLHEIEIAQTVGCGMGAMGGGKIAGAFFLQVTPDLPNPAEYEADRHRDRDLENHYQ